MEGVLRMVAPMWPYETRMHMNGTVITATAKVRITNSLIVVSEPDNLSKAERSQKKWGRVLSLKKERRVRRTVCTRELAEEKTQDPITSRKHRL
jgi:hypothetical protein